MANLTSEEKVKIRNQIEKIANQEGLSISWVKAQVNVAAQAVEDELINAKPAISAAIDVATTPFVFTNQQKKWIGALVMQAAFVRDYLP